MQQATWLKGRNSMCIFAVGRTSVPTQEKTTICAFVERTYLIIVSREGNHARSELLSKIFESLNVMGCIPLPACLWACKERFNLCMNRASLDRESLDRVSWISTNRKRFTIFSFSKNINNSIHWYLKNVVCIRFFNINYSDTTQMQPARGVLKKICSKITVEHLCRSAILIKLFYNFIEIALRHGCSPVNLLHIFRTPFLRIALDGCFCIYT